MKLSGILLCVAASSLVACADIETTGGGHMDGLHPVKTISYDPSDLPESPYPEVDGILQEQSREPATNICESCELTTYRVVEFGHFNKFVQEVSDGGSVVCRIFLDENMVVLNDECGRF